MLSYRVRRSAGGYNKEFIGKVSAQFYCSICSKVLRDPQVTECCAEHYCQSCLSDRTSKHCPNCDTSNFRYSLDKSLIRSINQLRVKCNNHIRGCLWTGKWTDEAKHTDDCAYTLIPCPNYCKDKKGYASVCKKDMEEHLERYCDLRPYRCEYCGEEDSYINIAGSEELSRKYISQGKFKTV